MPVLSADPFYLPCTPSGASALEIRNARSKLGFRSRYNPPVDCLIRGGGAAMRRADSQPKNSRPKKPMRILRLIRALLTTAIMLIIVVAPFWHRKVIPNISFDIGLAGKDGDYQTYLVLAGSPYEFVDEFAAAMEDCGYRTKRNGRVVYVQSTSEPFTSLSIQRNTVTCEAPVGMCPPFSSFECVDRQGRTVKFDLETY